MNALSSNQMPPEESEQSDQQQTLDALEKRLKQLEDENTKLKATKQGLLTDLRKRKTVDVFLKGAGIQLPDQVSEDDIPDIIATSLKSIAPAPTQNEQQLASGGTPAEAMDEAIKAQFNSLRKEIDTLKQQKEQAESEARIEKERRRSEKLEKMVTEELRKVDCRRPAHLYKLEREKFRLLDDDETVVYGSEDDPRSLRDAVTRLREDEEYNVYFPGSGATGSGMTQSKTQTNYSGNNPFAVGSVNATEVARLVKDSPEKARRLMMEARMAGKLDPVMAKAISI